MPPLTWRAPRLLLPLVAAVAAAGCARGPHGSPPVRYAAPSGEAASAVPAMPVGTPGGPRANLSSDERRGFDEGRALFFRRWEAAAGLGPYYNEAGCFLCHYAPAPGGFGDIDHGLQVVMDPARGRDVLLLHRRGLPGLPPPPGPPAGVTPLHGRPPSLLGIGLFEAVTDEEIRGRCGHDEASGVHGHPSLPDSGGVGRFGMSANQATLHGFIANALADEIGVTSAHLGDARGRDADGVADPEIAEADIDRLAAFVRGLAPAARDGKSPDGEALFFHIGCATCHRPDAGAAARGAYTDLCLHDLGAALAHNIPEHTTEAGEFRTAPLWGLRFHNVFLHDDRARSLTEAILAHGGEAAASRDRFRALPPGGKAQLEAFLQTL